jgi:hypothetical protein
LVENGRLKGFGEIDTSLLIESIEKIKSRLTAAYDDQDMSNAIHAYLSKHQADIRYFS